MDWDSDSETGGFSFIWTIQNFSHYFESAHELKSPSFVLETVKSIKWTLHLFFMRRNEGVSVEYFLSFDEIYTIPFHFALSIRNNNGSFKKYADEVCNTERNLFSGFMIFEDVEELGKKGTGAFLENDTLVLRCRMWKDEADLLQSVRCYAHTKLSFNKTVYVWTLDNFFALPNETKSTKVHNMSAEAPSFAIDLLTRKNGECEFNVQQIGAKKFDICTCKVSLLDADGKSAYSVRGKYCLGAEVLRIPFLPKTKLLTNKKLYLPNGTLSLPCEFTFTTGEESSRIEKTEYGNTEYQMGCPDQMADPDFPGSLKDCLQRFYSEGKFSDVTICANDQKFRAHKAILCARSEVFSAMFESNIKENQTGVVEIEDLDSSTVSKMLLFIYTDIIEDLEWESACELYYAADKYGIQMLKAKCSALLKSSVDVSNACDLLAFADRHQDEEFKWTVQKFIFGHSDEIMNSDEWKKFMQINLPLASETMHLLITSNSC